VFDPQDTTVFEARSLTIDANLLSLLLRPSNPGKITITRPVVHLVLTEKGSNLETVLKPILESKEKSTLTKYQVSVIEGVVNIHDRVERRSYQLQQLKVDLAHDKQAAPPWEVDAAATLQTDAQRAGLTLAVRAGDDAGGFDRGMLDCQVESVPLELVEPFLRRALPGARISGRAALHAHGVWGEGENRGTMALSGNLQARDLALTADCLGKDKLQLARIDVPCRLERRGTELRVDQLAIKTDVGQAAAQGSFLVKELTAAELTKALYNDNYRVEGDLNIAALAAMLPETMNIREGTRLTDGRVQLVVLGEPRRDGQAWEGRIETINLRATKQGKAIDLAEPVVFEFAARQAAQGMVIDRATCTSSFLTAEAAGTLADLQGKAKFDLARLQDELSQFIDLGSVELAGAGEAQLRLARQGNAQGGLQPFAARTNLSADNLTIALPGRRAWRERRVEALFDADGQLNTGKAGVSIASVDVAQLTCRTADERLSVKLLEPVRLSGSNSAIISTVGSGPAATSTTTLPTDYRCAVQWQGPLANWLARIDPWVNTVGWELDGNGQVQGTLVSSREGIALREAKLVGEPLLFHGAGVFIDEQRIELIGGIDWDSYARRLTMSDSTLQAAGIVAKLTQGEARFPTRGAPLLVGNLRLDAELARLAKWVQDPRQASPIDLAGKLVGQAVISRQGRITDAKLDARVDNLEVISRGSKPGPREVASAWRERQVSVVGAASYSDADDVLEITAADVASSALKANLAGKIASLATEPYFDLAGKIDYDWQTLAPLWRPYVGDEVDIVGRESRAFRFKGPYPNTSSTWAGMLAPLEVDASIGWQRAVAYGLPIGAGAIEGQLRRGVLEISPLDVPVSDGRVTIAPKIRLAPEPGEIRLEKGPVAQQIRFTREVTERYLKYAAPILVQTAKIDGQFSVDLDGGRLPLDDMASGDVGGRLVVHNVTVSPGPLATQILVLGKQVEDLLNGRVPNPTQSLGDDALITIQNQTIEVRMVNRRVYHRGLQFVAGKLPIRTTGSVGFDESLEILAEVFVPNEGIGSGAVVNALKGKTLQIPIRGTLTQPKLDDRALTQIAGQVLQNTAKDALQNEIGRQLDRLLPK
jgi:hypothetical protein